MKNQQISDEHWGALLRRENTLYFSNCDEAEKAVRAVAGACS